MEKYIVIGYIDQPTLATGFLIPVYQLGQEQFFARLSDNSLTIISFDICTKENYGYGKNFRMIIDGPKKVLSSSSFFVFKYGWNVYYGSSDDKLFIAKMKTLKEGLSNGYLKSNIEKVAGLVKILMN